MAAGLMDFLIVLVGLGILVGMIWVALDKIAGFDPFFVQIGRYAVGGAALLLLLFAVKGVLFGGAGGVTVTPGGILEFGIGLIVVLLVIYLLFLLIDNFVPPPFQVVIRYVVGALALIAILVIAQRVLIGGGLGLGLQPFRLNR